MLRCSGTTVDQNIRYNKTFRKLKNFQSTFFNLVHKFYMELLPAVEIIYETRKKTHGVSKLDNSSMGQCCTIYDFQLGKN